MQFVVDLDRLRALTEGNFHGLSGGDRAKCVELPWFAKKITGILTSIYQTHVRFRSNHSFQSPAAV